MALSPARRSIPVALSAAERAYAELIGDFVPGTGHGCAAGVRWCLDRVRAELGTDPEILAPLIRASHGHREVR